MAISTLEDAVAQNLREIGIDSEPNLDDLINSIKDKRVVMLGESSHGTKEFYKMRSLISQILIESHGFKFIAVEGDWPDAYRLNKYIQTSQGESAKKVLRQNHRWPTWMWANQEIVELAEWLKGKNASFYGLDIYSLFESIAEVNRLLENVDPELASEIRERYNCFESFQGDEIAYTKSLLVFPDGCEEEVLLNLQKLLEVRLEDQTKDGSEVFSLQQNARIIANAEAYYRAMIRGDVASWNIRDHHMMDTLDHLLEKHGEGAKAIVWAHNTHIGDYRATDMRFSGYVNLGGLVRQSYGKENVALVGFGTYQGEVLAGHAWDGPEELMRMPEAREGSYEDIFHKVAVKNSLSQYYLLFNSETIGLDLFAQIRGHRAIGVVYEPLHESRGNYVPTDLCRRYVAFIFIDRTHALRSLHTKFIRGKRGEIPETWPLGQ
jgi:erythromycin esterase